MVDEGCSLIHPSGACSFKSPAAPAFVLGRAGAELFDWEETTVGAGASQASRKAASIIIANIFIVELSMN
jgi:hypothetical protein